MTNRQVGLMAKYPEPGKVKTRLASRIGDQRACAVYERLLEHTIAEVSPASHEYSLGCFVEPPDSVRAFSTKYPDLDFYLPQNGYDLGNRMYHAFEQLLALDEVEGAVLIGGDIPGLTATIIKKAFELLRNHDIVWGPSTDGGYYLIGLRKLIETPFRDIPWSTPEVLERSKRHARKENLSFALLDNVLNDIDTIEDLESSSEFQDLINIKRDR